MKDQPVGKYAPMNDFGEILDNKLYKTMSEAGSNLTAEYNRITIIFKNK
tara:strand:+ start:421 stop:567 length:147 start_codon:yes stop_codon:yes gene_type:complete